MCYQQIISATAHIKTIYRSVLLTIDLLELHPLTTYKVCLPTNGMQEMKSPNSLQFKKKEALIIGKQYGALLLNTVGTMGICIR